jgi:Integrase zinc binding domain/Chromo (CHRromatin Organisation MOdifier) domain
MQGYQTDPSFKQAWTKVPAEESELLVAQRLYKSGNGLMIFRDADWVAQLCVLKSEVCGILRESHELPWETTHAGSLKLFHKLAARFYWPRMWVDIVDYIKTCNVCQNIKTNKWGPTGKLCPHTIPLLPFEVVTLDLITGLPKLEGYNVVLVIVDKLTKFVQYIPTTSNLKQEGFTKLFIQHIVLRYGHPRQMIVDRDARWSQSFWASVTKHLDLDLLLSTSHYPQTDSQMDKANDTLEVSLHAYTVGNRSSWAQWLGTLMMAHNSTPHSSTSYFPFFLLHGYSPKTKATVMDPVGRGIKRIELYNAAASSFVSELEVHRSLARDSLAWAQARQVTAYDSWRREEELEEGDKVLVNPHSLELIDMQGTGRKLVQWCISPFQISEKINPVVYHINIPPEYKMHPIINIQHLAKYHHDKLSDEQTKLPKLRELAKEEEYEVERIIGHHYNWSKRRREYLVRWKGYGPEHNTFKPEMSLWNAFSCLREYHKTLEEHGCVNEDPTRP